MRITKTIMAASLMAAGFSGSPAAAEVKREAFGQLPGGEAVEAITLENSKGMRATVITFGAGLQSLLVPDRNGELGDVVLGFDSMEGYLATRNYFGSTVGRVANRIAAGRFMLDGTQYQTTLNEGPNALHGGTKGFDQVLWRVTRVDDGPVPSVTMRYVSPHMDQGYPGTLTVDVTYSLDDTNTLSIDHRATTDRPTVVNISNHAYWNLAGEGAPEGAMNHVLTIPADHYTPVDAGLIPTGEIRQVAGTVFDFRTPTVIGARVRDASEPQIVIGKGYDHNWVIANQVAAQPRLLGSLFDPKSGRRMQIFSNQPALQFYSGNFLDATIAGKSGNLYRQGDAVVLEPQMSPDAPNRPEFGSVRLDRGQTYRNLIQLRFTAAP